MNGVTGDALEVRVTRLLGVLRLCAVAFEFAVVAALPDWYLTPTHLVVPAVAAGWGVVFALGCLRQRRLTRWLVGGEAAVGLLLAVAVTISVPPDELEGGPSWVLLRLIGSGITLVWFARTAVWLPYVGLLGTTTIATTWAFADVPPTTSLPPVASVFVVTVLFAVIAERLRAGARTTDAWLATLDEREHSSAVAAARLSDLRESERLVHDTVLNTLTGLSWGAYSAPEDDVRARCRRDVSRCEDVLGGTDDNDETMLAGLARAVDDARADGLLVTTSVSGAGEVPAEVGAAFVGAAREALSNVRRHAGTNRVRIDVRIETDSARIDVADEGRGFAPDAVGSDRFGIRRSIVERMADVGGGADVRSAPGRPTTVTLHWAAYPAVSGTPRETAEVEAAYVRDAVRAVGVAVVLWQAFLGTVLIGRWGRYSEPEPVVAIWLLTSAALSGCVVAALRRRPPGVPSAAVAGTVVAVVAGQFTAGLAGQPSDPIPLNWAMLSMYGVVAFLTVACPLRQWLPASVVAGASAIIVTLRYLGPGAEVVTYVGTYLYLLVVVQLLVSGIGPLRRQTAQATVRVARAEAELAADLRSAAVVRRDRRDRLRRLRIEALPLLAAVGDGELDPDSDEVRRRSRRCAATLRRTLQDTPGSGGLLGGIEVAVRAAEARGVHVVTQVAGTVDELPDATQAEVVRAVSQALDGVVDGRAVLTVTGDAASGSAFVAFPETAATAATAEVAAAAAVTSRSAGSGVAVDVGEEHEDGDVIVEVRWHTPT